MKVWWCEEHEFNGWPDKDICLWAQWGRDKGAALAPCRMVEMQLVPADARIVSGDALVVEKVEGEWPKRVLEILQYDVAMLAEAEPAEILDALAQVGGE